MVLELSGFKKLIAAAVFITVFSLCGYYIFKYNQKPPQYIILIGIDTLRKDHLSCYGYPIQTTPAIDAFARGQPFMSVASHSPPGPYHLLPRSSHPSTTMNTKAACLANRETMTKDSLT